MKTFTDSGKFTNVHAKNIHWCMQGPYIGLYRPITVKTSVYFQSLTAKAVVYIHINIYELSYAALTWVFVIIQYEGVPKCPTLFA